MISLKNIRSLSDFQRHTKAHIRRLKKTGRAEVLTVNGQAEVVVQSAQAYEQLAEEAEFSRHLKALRSSLDEADRGLGRTADAVFNDLARAGSGSNKK